MSHPSESLLRKPLEDVVHLLDGGSETFWSNKIRVVIGDPINPGEVLAWHGGMGSCNDLLIAE